jgi:hypothetical protein
MQILPIDIVALVASILGISIVLVPVIGLTARFAMGPVVEALSKLFEGRNADETVRLLERRLELQEQEIAMLSQSVRQLAEGREFDRQLGGGEQGQGRLPPSGDAAGAAGGG